MIIMLIITNLFAAEVAIQSPSLSDMDYQKQLMQIPDRKSYVDYVKSTNTPLKSVLLEELKQAQFQFLKGSLQQAKVHFNNIAELRLKAHWNKKYRKTIHYALLRLSQLSENGLSKQKWLKEAFQFSPELQVDEEVFSPQFIAEYNAVKSKHPMQVYSLPKNHGKFSEVLINGVKKSDGSSFIRSHGGNLKISFLSNKYQAVHMVTPAEQLKDRTLPLRELAVGDCAFPKFIEKPLNKDVFVLVDDDCQSAIQPTNSASLEVPPPRSLPPQSPQKAFYKKTWFWVGLSVVATGLAVHHYNQQNKNQPTASNGSSSPQEISNR